MNKCMLSDAGDSVAFRGGSPTARRVVLLLLLLLLLSDLGSVFGSEGSHGAHASKTHLHRTLAPGETLVARAWGGSSNKWYGFLDI